MENQPTRGRGLRRGLLVLTVPDLLLAAAAMLLCYVSFAYSDLYVTGNRAWLLYNNGLLDFYDASYRWAGNYGANYMPSVFWLYGIWNLPLRLATGFPEMVTTNSLLCNLWYKALPVLFYGGAAVLDYRIARGMGLPEKTARIASLSFAFSPLAVFSQFIFSQQDIFAVFFMLLGIRCDQQDKRLAFLLLFGVSFTFKYYTLPAFLIFLLLKEKRPLRVIGCGLVSALPFLAEYLLYRRSDGFQKGVFGFGMLGAVQQSAMSTHLGVFNLGQMLYLFLVAWAYFVEAPSEKERFAWALYLNCGVAFAMFGISTFNPQWILLAVPFWALSQTINRRREIFLWLECLLAPVFYFLVAHAWYGAVDDAMLEGGIWKYLYDQSQNDFHLYDLYGGDAAILLSVFVVVLLVWFVFAHPRQAIDSYALADAQTPSPWLYRLRFAAGPVLYMGLAFLTLAKRMTAL